MSSESLRLSAKAITHERLSVGERLFDSLSVFPGIFALDDESLKGQHQLRLSFSQPTGETRQARCERLLSGLKLKPSHRRKRR